MLGIDTFNFTDVMKTSTAWMAIALFNSTYQPQFYADLVFLTSKSCAELDQLIFYSTSRVQQFLQTNVFEPVFAHYNGTVCGAALAGNACTTKELAYQQWVDLGVFSNPPKGVPQVSGSYVAHFANMTSFEFEPEFANYISKSNVGQPATPITVADCVSFFHMNRLYNLEIIGDLLLAFNGTDYQTAFNQTQFVRYL